jgi:hypothetical protein
MPVINQITNFKIGGVTYTGTSAQLNTNSGVFPGAALPNKTVVLDASSSITGIGNLNCTTCTATNMIITNLLLDGTPLTSDSLGLISGVVPGTAQVSKALSLDSLGKLNSTLNLASSFVTGDFGTNGNGTNGVNGLFRFTANSGSCFIQAGTVLTADSAADIFFGNLLTTISTSSRKIIFKANGQVGINTSSPSQFLDVNGTSRMNTLLVGTSTDTSRMISVLDNTQGDNSRRFITLGKANTANNQLELFWHHTSDNSSANYGGFNVNNVNNILTMFANTRIGMNTSNPVKQLEINSVTGDCIRLTRNNNVGTATNFSDFSVDSDGHLNISASGGHVNISNHNGSTNGLELGGVLLTATANELNNVSGLVPGTVQASKLLIVDANKDLGTLRNLKVGGIFTNFNVGALKVASYGNIELIGRPIKYDLISSFAALSSYNPADQLDGNVTFTTFYSLEIVGFIKPQFQENYTFHVAGDDRIRLWVNDTLVFQSWSTPFSEQASQTIALPGSTWVPIRIHYQQMNLASTISIKWSSPSVAKADIDPSRMAWDNNQLPTIQRPYFMDNSNIFSSTSNSSVFMRQAIDTNGAVSFNITGGNAQSYTFNNAPVNITSGLQLGGTLITVTGDELNYNAGVTLGTIVPNKVITVDSLGRINGEVKINNQSLFVGDITGTNGILRITNSGAVVYLQTGVSNSQGSATDLFFGNISNTTTTSTRKIMFKANGFIGFGTATPTYPVSLVTTTNSSGFSHSDGTTTLNTFINSNVATIQTVTNSNLTFSTNSAASQLILTTGGNFNITTHNAATTGLQLNGILVTSSANEINTLAGITAGTALPSKALILDASSNLTGVNNFIATNLTGTLQPASASQPNITTIGTLTSLTSGAITTTGTLNINSEAGSTLRLNTTTNAARCNMQFTTPTTTWELGARGSGASAPADGFYIYKGAYRFVITSSGNIGIGSNTSPSYTCDVTGSARVTSQLFIGASPYTNAFPLNIQQEGVGFSQSNGTVSLVTNTGTGYPAGYLYTSTAHPLGLGAGNTGLHLVIQTNGNVGIGYSTTSASYKLDVLGTMRSSVLLVGDSTDDSAGRLASLLDGSIAVGDKRVLALGRSNTSNNQLEISWKNVATGSTTNYGSISTNGTSDVLNVFASGNVGISTTTPLSGSKLDINGLARAKQVLVGNSTDTASSRLISALDSTMTSGTGRYITLGQSASSGNQAEIAFNYVGAGSSANNLNFGFFGGASMYLTYAGNLGLGYSTPQYRLDVSGSARINGSLSVGSATIGSYPFTVNASGNGMAHTNGTITLNTFLGGSITGAYIQTASNHPLAFGTNNSSAQMTLTTAGNFGIGTTNPDSRLEVNGHFRCNFVTKCYFPANQSFPLEVGSIVSSVTNYGYLNVSGGTGTSGSSGNANFSARFDGRIIVGGEVDVVSDYRIKNNIADMTDSFCKEFIKTVNPVTYKLRKETNGKTHYGFIAQDLMKQGFEQLVSVVPEAGMVEIIEADGFVNPKDAKFTVCYDQIIPILTKNIQMLLTRVDQLEEIIKELKNK